MGLGRRSGTFNLPPRCDFDRMLAAQIVATAISDWRELIREKAWLSKRIEPRKNFTELRQFFESDWCALLMIFMELTPADILTKLEKELEEAKKMEALKNGRNERGN